MKFRLLLFNKLLYVIGNDLMWLKKGDRIKHPKMDAWGLGQVLENSRDSTVRVFFVSAGEKTLSLEYVEPVRVKGEEAIHPVLDNLKVSAGKYQSLPLSIKHFLETFPGGFNGARFISEERSHKVEAHRLGEDLLGQAALAELIAAEDFSEVTKRSLKLVNSTNLIFPNEKMALKDGLKNEGTQALYAKSLYQLLYGEDAISARFNDFAELLEGMGAAKWPIVSYFLFIMKPKEFMFVKPTITQHVAELCAFEINYKPQLNWTTYESVLRFSNHLWNELSELEPMDMIDIQSFMWCIAPAKK